MPAPESTEDRNSDKELTIVVNGRRVTTRMQELSFEEIVELAFHDPFSNPNLVYTVTYRRGHGGKPEGMLEPGETVKIREGMIFNVTQTDKS